MEYIWEAILIILAVIFPLSCVLLLLKGIIRNLGDSTTITNIAEREEE